MCRMIVWCGSETNEKIMTWLRFMLCASGSTIVFRVCWQQFVACRWLVSHINQTYFGERHIQTHADGNSTASMTQIHIGGPHIVVYCLWANNICSASTMDAAANVCEYFRWICKHYFVCHISDHSYSYSMSVSFTLARHWLCVCF